MLYESSNPGIILGALVVATEYLPGNTCRKNKGFRTMTINVPKQEFFEKWHSEDTRNIDEEVYFCGDLKGSIVYEDGNYFVIELTDSQTEKPQD